MVSEIKLLDSNLINQIAAGEVIERPVSVVKELVENALDAGATAIEVEVAEGGKKLIRVADNGKGMSAEDVGLAIQRHATSKIKIQEDLFKISTLGFRGEALPSIASVSQMAIVTKAKNSTELTATRLILKESAVEKTEKSSRQDGTTIEVRDLFYNVPARLKFLKKDSTELSHIQDYLSRLILARPDVSYTFISDGKTILQTQGSAGDPHQSLRNAIGTIYGTNVAKNLYPVELDLADLSVSGFVSAPTVLSASRSGQVFFVNNRQIFSPLLNKALDSAVRDLVPGGKYPYAILFLSIAYDKVDVNVHPAKREVRFAEGNKVYEALFSAVKNSYQQAVPATVATDADDFAQQHSYGGIPKVEPLSFLPKNFSQNRTASYLRPAIAPVSPAGGVDLEYIGDKNGHLTVLGQANRTYIIVLDHEDLLLIDQHAAQERIIYEDLKNLQQNKNSVQPLLIPENIELGAAQAAKLKEYQTAIAEFGFEWEEFSNTSVVLRAVPTLRAKLPAPQVLRELIDSLDEFGNSAYPGELQEQIRAMIACKAAIKAGDLLDLVEMRQLVKDLWSTPNYQTCPHGRPIVTAFTRAELDKRFKRT